MTPAPPAPPGYLSYGPLNHRREQTCHNCHATFKAASGRGTAHWCPDCRGGAAHRAAKAEYMKAYRERAKRFQAPRGAVLQVRIDGALQARPTRRGSLWPRLQFSNSCDGTAPVAGPQRTAGVWLAVQCPARPDRAAATNPRFAVLPVGAGGDVASIRLQHHAHYTPGGDGRG